MAQSPDVRLVTEARLPALADELGIGGALTPEDEAAITAAADRAEAAAASLAGLREAVDSTVAQSPADSAVASVVLQPGTQARAAVEGVTADAISDHQTAPGSLIKGLSVLGDSTVRGTYLGDSDPGVGSTTAGIRGMTWFTWACHFSGGRLWRGVNAGIIGNTLAQMADRLDADVINHPRREGTPVAVCSGYNDAYNDVSVADYMATWENIHVRLRAAQVEMIACTPLPTKNSAAVNARITEYADAIRAWAQGRGVFLLDLNRATKDPGTGGLLPVIADTGDGVHPGPGGHAALGRIVLDMLEPRLPRFSTPYRTLIGPLGQLTPNPDMTGTPDAKGLAPSNIVYGSLPANVTASVVDGAGFITGSWQRLTHTSATGTATIAQRITPVEGRISPGDVLGLSAMVMTSGPLDLYIGPEWYTAPYGEGMRVRGYEVTTPTRMYMELTVPAAFKVSYLDVIIRTGHTSNAQAGWAQIGELTLHNLTKLGRV